MNQAEADDLAMSLAQTWSYSPPADIWSEELADLDAMRARAAYQKLRRESNKSPSIAEFLAVYRNLAGTDRRPEGHCPTCGGTGFVTDTNHPHHWLSPRPMPFNPDQPDECICNISTWCPYCAQGERAKQRLSEIHAARPPLPEKSQRPAW